MAVLLRIAVEQGLIAPHAGVVVDVPGLGHAHDRVNEQVGFDLRRRSKRQFLMRPVHRVPGLERDHLRPSELGKLRPKLRRACVVTSR